MSVVSAQRVPPPVLELVAVSFLELGWSVIPVKVRGKMPLIPWEQYQRRRTTTREIHEWYEQWPNANLGIVTGAVSGLVVLDLDTEDAVRDFVGRQGPELRTPIVRTGRGLQVYFQHPGRPLANRTRGPREVNL